MNTYDYENALFRLDPNLEDFRDLKEEYIRFNSRNAGDLISACRELEELIVKYKSSTHDIFREFRNFEHFRNRFLYATRKAPVLNGSSDARPVLYFKDDTD